MAAHPEWKQGQTWDRMVSSYAVDTGDDVLLVDPVDVPAETPGARLRSCSPVRGTVATRRSSACSRADARPAARPARSRPGAGRGLPRRRHAPVRAFEGFEPNDLVLYVESRRAVVVGDTLIDRGNGLQVHPDWPVPAWGADEVIRRLRPLLDLPVEVVLPTHADPTDRAALERALSV
jgi:hypothetical protein